MMTLMKQFIIWIFCVGSAVGGITSSPGMQRKQIGQNCIFQWTVSGTITSYSIFNQSNGTSEPLSAHGNHTYDSEKGVISLMLWSVRLSDAGNYSLSVNTGTYTVINSGALLFVYSSMRSPSKIFANSTLPAYEGQGLTLTCVVNSTSLPAMYRPPMEYFWAVKGDRFVSPSSSPAKTVSGMEVPRHFFEDDGRTLVISPLQRDDIRYYECLGREKGATFYISGTGVSLGLYYRPYVSSLNPPSKKFNVDVGGNVNLRISFEGDEPTNSEYVVVWTFVTRTGSAVKLSELDDGFSRQSIHAFNLTSDTEYGQYHFSITNSIGTTSDFFTVLPTDRPEAPSNLSLYYATSSKILLNWRCMWANGRQQTVFVELKDTKTNAIIETVNISTNIYWYNRSMSHTFRKDIQADRIYQVSMWSNNSLGLSDIVKLNVQTPKRFRLLVSSKSIVIDNNTAVISFRVLHARMTQLEVTCCSESTGDCNPPVSFAVNDTTESVTYTNPPKWDVYLFDFRALGGGDAVTETHFLGLVKGVRVSTLNDEETDGLVVAVIVLSVLFSISLLGLIGCLIAFIYFKKFRGQTNMKSNDIEMTKKKTTKPPDNAPQKQKDQKPKDQKQKDQTPKDQKPKKLPPPRKSLPDPSICNAETKSKPDANARSSTTAPAPIHEEEGEMYEPMDKAKAADEEMMYTPLDQPPPTRINIYT